ncbi:hypothetical protein M405DRAFT_76370 [Rhizopogon salebrosus TDB-379]|nr:hypothetical protein M405DRAFT_76370 [Rhizopogon salebrosus TDB-379]
MSGMRAVKILTWSSSPFDVTIALGHHAQLTPVPFRCMRNMSDLQASGLGSPSKPSETQPSAWHAHRSIRKVILSLWGLVVVYGVWAAVATLLWDVTVRSSESSSIPWVLWSFFPSEFSISIWWNMPLDGSAAVQWWILSFVTVALAQGPLTLGLHCSELIVNVIRHERQWRRATERKGLRMTTSPLKSFSTDPLSLVLFVAKPALHWMFGLSYMWFCEPKNALVTNGHTLLVPDDDNIMSILANIYPAQILNLCIALLIFACLFTLVALHRPRGPQPAAYGHLQTLANLIDEWSPVTWWGHKENGIPYCHAGTSDHLLPPVKMD